jgi:hypothetical protein
MQCRRWVLAILCVGAGVLQAAGPEAPFLAPNPAAPPEAWTSPAASPVPIAGSPGGDPVLPLSAEALLGLPMALRLQAALPVGERVALALEGTAGLYIVVPFGGIGGRVLFSVGRGPEDALQINPGIEFDIAPALNSEGSSLSLITPTVQLLWLHKIAGSNCQCEVGVEVGGGMPLEYPGRTNYSSRIEFIPRICFGMGVRF